MFRAGTLACGGEVPDGALGYDGRSWGWRSISCFSSAGAADAKVMSIDLVAAWGGLAWKIPRAGLR